MFLGEYKLQFSGQGRIVLPRKFREELQGKDQVVLSRGIDGCVWGFDKNSWEDEAKKQLEVSLVDKSARDLRRYLFSGAESVDLDSQGRFVIPQILLGYAGIKDEVAIIGAGDHFEIWSFKKWKHLIKNITKDIGKT